MQLSSVAILTLAFPKTKEIQHQALLFWRRIRVIRTCLHGTALTAAMEVMAATAAIVLTLPIHRITQVSELTYSSCNNRAYGGHTIVASVFSKFYLKLRQRRRAFVHRAYGLDRSASITNSFNGLRHHLIVDPESVYIWHGTSAGRFRAVKVFSIVHPLAPVGRATQELKQRCSGCMVTAATLFMLHSGSWLR